MRVLIVEQNHLGHYYPYDRLVIEALREIGADVILAVTPEGFASEEFRVHLSAIAPRIDVRPILRLGRGGIVRGIRDAIANLSRAVKETQPDVMYVVTADGIAQAAGLARMAGMLSIPKRVHCECLINRLAFTYPNSRARLSNPNVRPARPLSTKLSILALRKSPFSKIHLTDTLAWRWIQTHGGALAARVHIIADPIETFTPMSRGDARRRLGIPEEGRYLICPGLLDNRKGIPLLVEALANSALDLADRLVLAGSTTPEIAAELRGEAAISLQKSGRLIVIDRVMSSEEIAAALWAADVVVCTYPHQPHPASVALKALGCGRPTLASDTAWLGEMIPKFNMGWTVNIFDPAALSAALAASLDQAPSWKISEAGMRLVQFSSAENYKNSWAAGIREMMKLPPSDRVANWSLVAGDCTDDKCPACGAADLSSAGPVYYPPAPKVAGVAIDLPNAECILKRCAACEFQFKFPPVAPSALLECYAKSQANHWSADPIRRKFDVIKAAVMRRARGRKILDIGCSNGALLDYFGGEWIRYGLEPSHAAACAASGRGIQILGATVDDLDPTQQFDVILAIDVLEHIPNPAAFSAQISRHLSPGGIFVILTGDADAWSWRLHQSRYWYVSYLPEHTSFYTRRTIDLLAERHGMHRLDYSLVSHDRNPIGRIIFEYAKGIVFGGLYRSGWLGLPWVKRRFAHRYGTLWICASDHMLVVLQLR